MPDGGVPRTAVLPDQNGFWTEHRAFRSEKGPERSAELGRVDRSRHIAILG